MRETMDMRGQLIVQLSDRAGQIVHRQRYKNHIVTAGRMLVAQLFTGVFDGPAPVPVTHMAVGSARDVETPDPPADGDGDLVAQRGERKPISVGGYATPDEGGVTRVRVSLESVFDFDDANDPDTPLREAGIFNAAEDGVMYNRVVFEPVTKTEAFKLTLLWDVTF